MVTDNLFTSTVETKNILTGAIDRTLVSQLFDTDPCVTACLIVDQYKLNNGVSTMSLCCTPNYRTFEIIARENYIIKITNTEINGGSQEPGVTQEQSEYYGLAGVSAYDEKAAPATYVDGVVGVWRKGVVTLQSIGGFDVQQITDVYIKGYGDDRGKITDQPDEETILIENVVVQKANIIDGLIDLAVNMPEAQEIVIPDLLTPNLGQIIFQSSGFYGGNPQIAMYDFGSDSVINLTNDTAFAYRSASISRDNKKI